VRAAGDIRAQAFADRGEAEAAVRLLAQHPGAREEAQEAMEGRGMGRGGLGELAGRPRAVLEPVGDAQGRGQIEGAREIVPGRHLVEHDLRRQGGRRRVPFRGHATRRRC